MSSDDKARVANIFDVARLAGVSHQTVSRVVNDLPNVRPATRKRVEDAIRQLRYRPSTNARALVTRRSRMIGVITTGNPDYGPSSTLQAFTEASRGARYNVSITSMLEADPVSMRAAVETLLSQSIEAMVLIAAHRGALDSIQGLDIGVPLVAVDSSSRPGFHSVSIDQFHGARLATQHLIDLGHRSIVHLAGPSHSMDASERERGWRAALSAAGLVARAPLEGDWSPHSGYELGSALAAAGDFTAMVCGNDQMALGAMFALRERGIRVPEDVSIVGFDDIPESAFFTPPLTTVHQDFAGLGSDIMARLLDLLHEDDVPDALPQRVPTLVSRESTAPPQSSPVAVAAPQLRRP
ncbi:LacI family DNA-binding transcriptional regulator [Homoserinimonas hongtaonis]|uniref:LacI family DNA-binding transcriptional regulator n=1 Tax=Homoserinimonas hongtaonis TaxID=2079791 RepID=A0A2U1T0I2_9MICO|nr:LacI family DNA-binding transcriptional regulator [Salinibacterium hongtaonis]AWB89918.1 transcriptional regulator [Salinibacterium hongtaonis]PWB97380.1 LacI family DNA-binding transcriptional regulator [Salinibacterium hongtaonis]